MLSTLLSVALLWGLAVVTPGPNFVVVTHAALTASRRAAAWSVLGIVIGTAIWGGVGVLGLGVMFTAVPWTYLVLKTVGGAYLIWLGLRLLWAARPPAGSAPKTASAPGPAHRAVARGFLTVVTNPKSALFVASLMAAVLPPDPGIGLGLAIVALMVGLSALWYGAVAWTLGHDGPRRAYRRAQRAIETLAGTLFVLFGVRLLAAR
ncbi:LysE family translocator [Rhodospira trueperi]|uniref:Threonine/homoserine/homoserine lactone efflux protein n=1 Tax=Rhodospira trueperi TaxID=69960 RepID=A0A1G7BXD9_9PROT|nr:LysE family transporter [Rhodospira trueperi]SDE31764.1 Threonine/homoserine/homoserine lactone efflux protein [Rhodospira trueperi]